MALAPDFVAGFIRRMSDALNAHDPDAVAALCSEDVAWEDSPARPHSCSRFELTQ